MSGGEDATGTGIATGSGAEAPLRIALLCYRGNMHCGGQGVYLWHLARELSAAGHRVEVFTGPPAPDPMPFCAALHEVWSDEFWSKWFRGDRSAFLPRDRPWATLSPLRFYELVSSWIGFFEEPFAFSARVFRALSHRAGAFDIIHDVQSLGWGLLGLRALGFPVVTTVHHPLTVDRRAALRRDQGLRDRVGTLEFHPVAMQARVARRLEAVLTSSRVGAALLERDFGVAPGNIRIVGNGLDTQVFSADHSLSRNPRELLCVARAGDPNKGVGTLLEALRALPEDVHLTLVDDHPEKNPARLRARALGVAQRLHITGPLSQGELVDRYRRAALVVVPSRFEGFGLPAVEALACETPVVACRGGALPEVLRRVLPDADPESILVAPDRPVELAAGIRALLGDPARAERLGRTGRGGVVRHFGWPSIASRTAAVYREVLDVRGRPRSTRTSAIAGHDAATRSKSSSDPRAA